MEKRTPRVKKKEIRIREIQDAAKRLFFRKGFQNVTIQQIARLARVSVGTVYLYFKNKDELYISLMTPFAIKFQEYWGRMNKEVHAGKYKSGLDFMKGLFKNYQEIYHFDPDAIKIIQSYQHGNFFREMSHKTREQLDGIARVNFQISRQMIQKAKDLGLIESEILVTELADLLLSVFNGLVILEGSKLRATGKDHLFSTLDYAFYLISKAICRDFAGGEWKRKF